MKANHMRRKVRHARLSCNGTAVMGLRDTYDGTIFLDLALPQSGLRPLCGSDSGHEPVQDEAHDPQEAHWDCCQSLHMPCKTFKPLHEALL